MGKKRNRSNDKTLAAIVVVTAVINLINSVIELIKALK